MLEKIPGFFLWRMLTSVTISSYVTSENLKSINMVIILWSEAVVRRFSSKWVFLNILRISQENTCAGVSF